MPFADVGPAVIPDWMDDEDALLCTDALSTGYFGAQLADIAEGDTVAVFGAGPVGLYAAKSAWLMGAGRVIVIDYLENRLAKARTFAQQQTVPRFRTAMPCGPASPAGVSTSTPTTDRRSRG